MPNDPRQRELLPIPDIPPVGGGYLRFPSAKAPSGLVEGDLMSASSTRLPTPEGLGSV
jgi:hypothetical protein